MKPLITSLAVLGLMGLSQPLGAEPLIPKNPSHVVASWPVEKPLQTSLHTMETVEFHLQQARFPGKASRHFGRAAALLKQIPAEQHKSPQYRYLKARIQQHQHQFSNATNTLNDLLKDDPNHAQGRLLLANILLTQGHSKLAQQACQALTDRVEGPVLAACFLEVSSYTGDLQRSYDVLSTVAAARVHRQDDIGQWLAQILASQALRLGRIEEATYWITKVALSSAHVSTVVLWADIHLQAEQAELVLSTLSDIALQHDYVDDAIILRLAIAESGRAERPWRKQAQSRMHLRLQRGDSFHAADLARYFIFVEPDAAQAKHWARLNWQTAKRFDDAELLSRANTMETSS